MNETDEVNLASIAEIFTPISLDVGPLHEFLLTLAKQVEAVQAENAALKERIDELELESRLETIETSLAEMQQPEVGIIGESMAGESSARNSPNRMSPFIDDQRSTKSPRLLASAGVAAPQQGLGNPDSMPPGSAPSNRPSIASLMLGRPAPPADSGWILHEFTLVKDRLGLLEQAVGPEDQAARVAEATESLKLQQGKLELGLQELQSSAEAFKTQMAVLDESALNHEDLIRSLQSKISDLMLKTEKTSEASEDSAAKMEINVNQIWDQIRHVENSLSQRLTLAETSQVNMLQEVDETKETSLDVMARVEELRRHTAALESKLESFNSQVAAAIQPLHTSLSQVTSKMEDLSRRKQDASNAVTMDDVSIAVSRAVDHADRRADNIIKSIGAMEGRVEELNDLKADKSSVVMTTDLEVLLKEHAAEMNSHMENLKRDIFDSISVKADKDELSSLDTKLGARVGALEGAILKGLKAISDKVSAALSEKLDLSRFNDFKVQVRAVLADVEDRLRDWSPVARGMKVPLNGTGALGASSCLCCDTRVRGGNEKPATIGPGTGTFSSSHKVFMPDRLPSVEGLLPSITANKTSPDVGSYNNYKAAQQRKRETAEHMARSAGSIGEMYQMYHGTESVQDGSGGFVVPTPLMFSPQNTGSRLGSVSTGAAKAGAPTDSISGAIAEGRIPNTRGKGGPPGSEKPERLAPIYDSPHSCTNSADRTSADSPLPDAHHPSSSYPPLQGQDNPGATAAGGAATTAAFSSFNPPAETRGPGSSGSQQGSMGTRETSKPGGTGMVLELGPVVEPRGGTGSAQVNRRASSGAGSVADFPIVEPRRNSAQNNAAAPLKLQETARQHA